LFGNNVVDVLTSKGRGRGRNESVIIIVITNFVVTGEGGKVVGLDVEYPSQEIK